MNIFSISQFICLKEQIKHSTKQEHQGTKTAVHIHVS